MLKTVRRWFHNPQRVGTKPSALAVVLGTTTMLLIVMLASFTPGYAQVSNCYSGGSNWCVASTFSPCTYGCAADNEADLCVEDQTQTITWKKLDKVYPWPRCTGASGHSELNCTESLKLCANLQAFFYGSLQSGGTSPCDYLRQCTSTRTWKGCAATGTSCPP